MSGWLTRRHGWLRQQQQRSSSSRSAGLAYTQDTIPERRAPPAARCACCTAAGINAYVAYQVVGQYGTGELTYSQAMTAIFIEGWIFVLLSITGVRGGIVKYMPKSIAMASSGGLAGLLSLYACVRVRGARRGACGRL